MTQLTTLSNLPALLSVEQFNPLLEQLFPDLMDDIQIIDFFESQEDGVTTFSLVLAFEQSLIFTIPGLQICRLGVVVEDPEDWPVMLCELIISGAPMGINIKHFPLRIWIDNPLLESIASDDPNALEGFSFEIEGSFGVDLAGHIHAQLDHFSLPPFTIVGTGMTLALEECQLITDSQAVDGTILDLGFDDDFRGIFARSAMFDWPVPIQLNNASLPGIHATLSNIALGNQGLSCRASFQWQIQHSDQGLRLTDSELVGALNGTQWALAVEQLDIEIRANIPIGSQLKGLMYVPPFATLLQFEFGFEYQSAEQYTLHFLLSQASNEPIVLPLGHSGFLVSLQNLQMSGEYEGDHSWQLSGRADLSLSLPDITLSVENLSIELNSSDSQTTLQIDIGQCELNEFGQLEDAVLLVVLNHSDEGSELAQLSLHGTILWQSIASRITLANQSQWLPLPADDGEVTLKFDWTDGQVKLSIQSQLQDVNGLWPLIPPRWQPEVNQADLSMALQKQGSNFSGELGVDLLLELPDISSLLGETTPLLADFITLDTGNAEGVIELSLTLEAQQDAQASTGALQTTLSNPFTLMLNFPGLAVESPPIQVQVEEVALSLLNEDGKLRSQFDLTGSFILTPLSLLELTRQWPPLIAQNLRRLLSPLVNTALSGSVSALLGVTDERSWCKFSFEFEQANIEVDLFDLLTDIAGGSASLFNSNDNNSIDLDLNIAVQMKAFSLYLGSEEGEDDEAFPFGVELDCGLDIGGIVDFPIQFELTHEHLSFGLTDLRIPLAIPQLPLSLDDLNRLKNQQGMWDIPNRWHQIIAPELQQNIDKINTQIAETEQQLQLLVADLNHDTQQLFQLQYRLLPSLKAQRLQWVGKQFLYQAILFIHQNVDPAFQPQYQQYIELYQQTVDTSVGWLHFDTQIEFHIRQASFLLPFDDPSDLRVQGSASLAGIAADSPFSPLNDWVLNMGISADAIYFALEGGLDPIQLPDFGRYPGNQVQIDKILIGYGYSKNSLKIDFAGGLILSEQLIEDADTSQSLGVGVRLPSSSQVKFKLDLIPITLGEVDFLLPLADFDLDLRSQRPPPPAPLDGSCKVQWDGLEFILGEQLHLGLKRYKVSPFFGPVPCYNGEYALDIQMGNEQSGLTLIADYRMLAPIAGVVLIPLLTDASPFFERNCTRIDLGGFGLSFDLTRPFPHPSPLLIFELLGLLSDPTMPLDPQGQVANLMYAELYHGRIQLPPVLTQLFPTANRWVDTNYSGRINIASVLPVFEHVQSTVTSLIEHIEKSSSNAQDFIEDLAKQAFELNPNSILESLPAQLRCAQLHGKFVHFQGDACLYFALATDFAKDRQSPEQPYPGRREKLVYENDFSSGDLSQWQELNYGLKRGKGQWQVKDNRLEQTANVGDNSPARYGAMLVAPTEPLNQIRVCVELTSRDNDGMGVVFALQDKDRFYRFRMTGEQNRWHLDKIQDGEANTLFEQNESFDKKKTYKVVILVSHVRHSDGQLRAPFDRRISKPKIAVDGLQARRTKTHVVIEVLINGHVWCRVEDKNNPLIGGKVGLDSWWNQPTYFDQLQIFEVNVSTLNLLQKSALPKRQQVYRQLASDPAEQSDGLPAIFAFFDENDLAEAMDQQPENALVLAANVQVFGQQVFRFLGAVTSDGRFRLTSSINNQAVELRVAGIPLPLALTTVGRMTLEGKAEGAHSHAQITVQGYSDWRVFPQANGQGDLLRLTLGSESDPVTCQVGSPLDFIIKGHGQLLMFNNQIVIDAELDINQQYCLLKGSVSFEPDWTISGQQVVLLNALCQGQIGPQEKFNLYGEGQLQLLGKTFSASGMRIHQQGIELTAELEMTNPQDTWFFAQIPLRRVALNLQAQVDFQQPQLTLRLDGIGSIDLFNTSINGRCLARVEGNDCRLDMFGSLSWLGKNWLDASLRISNQGVDIRGQTSFNLPLSANQLAGNIQLAGLQLNVTLAGLFRLDSQGALVHWDFELDWTLAVHLPNHQQSQQQLPIASQHLHVDGNHGATSAAFSLSHLFSCDQLNLFDMSSIAPTIPLPNWQNPQRYYLSSVDKSVAVPSFTVPVVTLSPTNADGEDNAPVPLTPLFIEQQAVTPGNLTFSVPNLTTTAPTGNASPLFSLPQFTNQQLSLGALSLSAPLSLELAWQNGQLGILIEMANNTTFYPFQLSVFSQLVRFDLTTLVRRR